MKTAIKLFATFLVSVLTVQAQTFSTLYTFTGGQDGQLPAGRLTMDTQGNLYGATTQGGVDGAGCGAEGCGTIFELSLVNGTWSKTTLYSFPGGAAGIYPNSNLVLDAQGNLYGTTQDGGNKDNCGIVFELSQGAETVLHTFDGKDGCSPVAGPAIDAAGNLYGATFSGGLSKTCTRFKSGCGTIFELTPSAQGWSFSVLSGMDDLWFWPDGPLTLDAQGNLYGTTMYGIGKLPSYGAGVAFKLYPRNGKWYHQFLHTFSRWYQEPYGGLAFDQDGNLYGVTIKGVGDIGSSVYEIFPTAKAWECTYLKTFPPKADIPLSGVTVDSSGNLYGVTAQELFKLTRNGNSWDFSTLYSFPTGTPPNGNVILDASGNIYGVIEGDGVTTFGAVYEIQQ
jgi:uncharacterized repeat protein (TIGR03803 family)